MADNAVSMTVNQGISLIIGFVMALILQEIIDGQFTDGTVLSLVADNVVILYLVLVVALFAVRMTGGLGDGAGRGPSPNGF